MKFWQGRYIGLFVDKVRSYVREHDWKQPVRSMLVLRGYYPRRLALLSERRVGRQRLTQEHQDREKQLKELKNSLERERREVHRLKKRLKRQREHRSPLGGIRFEALRQLVPIKRGERRPPIGGVRFGDLRRLSPISRNFGVDRGRPVDRYYVDNFLARHADDIRGRVLEIKDATYTRRYGGKRVNVSDVLDVAEDNHRATIVADLTYADHVPSDTFDCVIFTQTLHFIYDVRAAIQTIHRILKPGGALLATFPGISQTSCREYAERYGWAFTQLSARRLFEEAFPAANIRVEAHGNVLAAIAFLHGLAVEELRQEELDYHDPDYEVLITLKALKQEETPS